MPRVRIWGLMLASAVWLSAPAAAVAQEGWLPTASSLSAPFENNLGGLHSAHGSDAAGNVLSVFLSAERSTRQLDWARFDAASGRWSSPARLSTNGGWSVSDLSLAVSRAGDAVVVWQQESIVGFGRSEIVAARYSAATGTWSPNVLLSGGGVSPDATTNPAGLSMLVWRETSRAIVRTRSLDLASGAWGSVRDIPTPLGGYYPAVGIDAIGNAVAIWMTQVYGPVAGARFEASSGAWGSVSTVLPWADQFSRPRVAMNAAGVAAAVVGFSGAVAGAISSPAGPWTSAQVLSTGGYSSQAAAVAVDATGNVFMAWPHAPLGSRRVIRVQRYDAGRATWDGVQEVGDTGEAFDAPALAVDGAGNAWVAWTHALRYSARIQGVRFVAALGTWTAAANLAPPPGPFEATVESWPKLSIDAKGNTTLTYQWWKYNNTLWKAARWHATSAAPVVTDVVPAPGSLQVSATMTSATDPALTVTNLEYSLDDGATWVARSPALAAFPLTIAGLADGLTYPVRVRAVNVAGPGAASVVLPARSGTDVAPANLRIVSRTGNRVTLAWTPPVAGLVPTSYVIEGGFFGHSQVLATLPSAGAATQLTLDVPYGAYFVRVASAWNGQRLGTSPSLLFAVDANPEPAEPVGLLGSSAGSTLALSWRTTWEGASPTGVRLFVFGAITASLDLPMSESFVFPAVPPGTYTFAVSSIAGSRVGPQAAPVTLTFPGACAGAPTTPAAFHASTRGGTVYLDWLPPSSGEAVTGYVVSVSGAFNGSFPASSRSFTSPAPPGSYTFSVRAAGPCGTSAATTPTTVVVP